MQRFGNQLFAHVRPIRIGGVDKIDSEFDRPPKHANRLVVVLWGPPDSFAGYPHRSKSQPPDWQVAANPERSAFGRRQVLAEMSFAVFRFRFVAHGLIPPTVFLRIWSARPLDARVMKIETKMPGRDELGDSGNKGRGRPNPTPAYPENREVNR